MKRVIAAILTVLLLCTVLLTGCIDTKNKTAHSEEPSLPSAAGPASAGSLPDESPNMLGSAILKGSGRTTKKEFPILLPKKEHLFEIFY
ncbi:MAG: hypothetical protein IJZ37_02940 [Clostridia bacterium]|nr:hypothetical protein [Clostridia bacterium]MBQ8399802.1 hypothetical protein [Clostridia bacterium]